MPYEPVTGETIDARDLHDMLKVGKYFPTWMRAQIDRFQLVEPSDFKVKTFSGENPLGGRPRIEYTLSLSTAKRIALGQNSEAARQAHAALIQLENDWNSPEKTMARAVQFATQILARHEEQKKELFAQVLMLTPKAEVYDRLNASDDDRNIRTTLQMLGLPEMATIIKMIDDRILYRDSKEVLTPYAEYLGPAGQGWFRVINPEDKNRPGKFWKQTVVTAAGRIALAKRYQN